MHQKIARIMPVFNASDKNDIRNYRPISILPPISKIIEKLMLSKLTYFINKYNILKMLQHSFRSNNSASTALVLDFISTNIDNKLSVIALFLIFLQLFIV